MKLEEKIGGSDGEESACNEHWHTCVLFNSGFLRV